MPHTTGDAVTRSITDEADTIARSSDAIIEVRELTKTYDTGSVVVHALRGVTLDVKRGEMVAIMGPSGCGKTTLLNCLSGIDDPTTGQVLIDGADLNTLDDNTKTAYRARHMGFVFQFYNLLPVLSAVENVELPLLVSGTPPKRGPRASHRRTRACGPQRIGPLTSPSELSGGQRQRVTIARALVNNPAIVWADEPTGDLDTVTAGEIMDLIQGLNRDHGQTFVLVTHDSLVAARCHRTIHMVDGGIEREETNHSFHAT